MTHPVYSAAYLGSLKLYELKAIAHELGVIPAGNKIYKAIWIEAIEQHQTARIQAVPPKALVAEENAPSIITADGVTEGDILLHLDSPILVMSEPEYTSRGICFEVLWYVGSPDNTQSVCFAPQWQFELLSHQRAVA